MFTELYQLIQDGTEIDIKVKAAQNGTIKVFVMPALGKNGLPAMATPLVLCATPAELDAGFATAIANYQASRGDLAAQVAITTNLLATAKQAQAASAVKALKNKAGTPAKVTSTDDDDDSDDDGDGGGGSNDSTVTDVEFTNVASAPQAVQAEQTGTNLLSLMD
jgi:PRTRC genetic system protein E